MSEKKKRGGGRKWWKYSPEFKKRAVERLVGGESPAALGRELKLRPKLLYEWKAQGRGLGEGQSAPKREEQKPDPAEREIARLKAKMAEIEGLNGRQAAELDFFGAALRSIKGARSKSVATTGKGSTK